MSGPIKSRPFYLAIGAAILIVLIYGWKIHPLSGGRPRVKEIAETFKNYTEAFAWVCAGGFFLYKAVSGYEISNLTLSLTCQRQSANSGKDYLVVTANLKKGDRAAVSLRAAMAKVIESNGKHQGKSLSAIGRLSSKLGPDGAMQLLETPASDVPWLNLPPGDETTFAAWFEVPSGDPVTVEVTILGGWRWQPQTRYQWRASAVSLPIKAA